MARRPNGPVRVVDKVGVTVRLTREQVELINALGGHLTGKTAGPFIAMLVDQTEPYLRKLLAGLEDADGGNPSPLLDYLARTSGSLGGQLETLSEAIRDEQAA